jgi:hypothetical protein
MTSVSSSRQAFREEVYSRRASFTSQELGFLSGLMVDGTEDEIARAAKRVSDISLFATGESHNEAVDEARSSFGSDRRRQSLALRRQSQVHTQIWKAHEGGLALSRQSSRRSLDNDKERDVVRCRRGSLVVGRRASSMVKRIPPHSALSADARRTLLKTGGSARRGTIPGNPPAAQTRRASRAAGSASFSLSDQTRRPSGTSLVGFLEGHDASVGGPWGGMQEEVEDKKMSDEDLATPSQWAKLLMRRASIGAYDGEGFEVGMFAQSVQDDERVEQDKTDVEVVDEEGLVKKSHNSFVMRRASVNYYGGEGMEIADWDAEEEEEMRRETLDKFLMTAHEHHPHSMAFLSEEPNAAFKHRRASFDESQSLDREKSFPEVTRAIQRSLSEDELSSTLTVDRGKYA